MKFIVVAMIGLTLITSLASADTVERYAGTVDYKSDNGDTDQCDLLVETQRSLTNFLFEMYVSCSKSRSYGFGEEFDVTKNDIYFQGDKVGFLTSKHIVVNLNGNNGIYALEMRKNSDGSLTYSDKLCYENEPCDELNGLLKPD